MSTTLIILGESLNPSVISQHLKLKPSQAWKKGERKSFKKRDGTIHFFNSRYEWGGWKLWSTKTLRKKELPEQIAHWGTLLTRKKKALEQIRKSGCEIFIDCCIIAETDCVRLPPELTVKLGALGVTIDIIFHAPLDRKSNQ